MSTNSEFSDPKSSLPVVDKLSGELAEDWSNCEQLLGQLMNSGDEPPPANRKFQLPMRFGEFTLHRVIGHGGMGVVYEATQPHDEQKLAVKVLHNRSLQSERLTARFIREAKAASRLHHANIVPPRQYGCVDGCHFLAMVLVDGKSLDRLIRPMSQEDEESPLMQSFIKLRSDWTWVAQLGATVASAL